VNQTERIDANENAGAFVLCSCFGRGLQHCKRQSALTAFCR
jgi:hypothetical protein